MFQEKKKMFKVISPIDKRDGSKFWMRCGVGYRNKDESINMYIDALPVNANKDGRPLTLQLREVTEEEMRERSEKRASSGDRGGGGSDRGYSDRGYSDRGYSDRGGASSSSSSSSSYSARGTLGRPSTFDPPDPNHIPMIPGAGGLDHLNALNAQDNNNDQPPF
ncbi:MAG TPA: hypothetical protein VMZ53_17625 [Kofleriaceae bacterium]|nr:hypothetical protein [Kofleriaceae bacterium]